MTGVPVRVGFVSVCLSFIFWTLLLLLIFWGIWTGVIQALHGMYIVHDGWNCISSMILGV